MTSKRINGHADFANVRLVKPKRPPPIRDHTETSEVIYTDEQATFLIAIDRLRKTIRFPTYCDILALAKQLGYRLVEAGPAAPEPEPAPKKRTARTFRKKAIIRDHIIKREYERLTGYAMSWAEWWNGNADQARAERKKAMFSGMSWAEWRKATGKTS